jgi:hypothetical protein
VIIMVAIAIGLLWFLIGAAVLCGIVAFVFYGLKVIMQIAIPPRVEQVVWFIVLCLILIGLLTVLGGGGLSSFHLR